MEEQSSDLVESYIQKLFNFCDNFLDQKKEPTEKLSDNPIIDYDEFITNGIQANQLKEINVDNVTFICADGLSYTTWLPQPNIAEFKKAKAFPLNSKGQLTAKSITVLKGKNFTGLAIAGNNRWFNINIEFVFGGLWGYVWKNALPDGLMLTGEDAYRFWCANFYLYQAFEAEIFSREVGRNPSLMPYIKEYKPYLLDYPSIQSELAKAYKQGFLKELPAKKGRPKELTKDILNLYFWVYFYRFEGLSLNEACKKAITKQSELVPDDWGDMDETLKKIVIRIDKIPSISQKTSYIEFKKMKMDKM